MSNNPPQERSPNHTPAHEPWGPLAGLDPVQEYRALALELQECYPDAEPRHLDRMIAREMALYGGHSLAVITEAMLQASLYLRGRRVGNAHDYVERTVGAAMQQEPTDNIILGWGI